MKLLFDENLSHKLARLLEDLFPNSLTRHFWFYPRRSIAEANTIGFAQKVSGSPVREADE